MISESLRNKMEELSKQHSDNDYESIRFKQGFTACHDELTKVPEDVEHLIDAHAVQEYNGLKQEINRNNFRYGANFFRSEIMPSLIEQARVNAIKECVRKLKIACEALEHINAVEAEECCRDKNLTRHYEDTAQEALKKITGVLK